jgi:Ala-tRNA(Pro) deacylase
MATRSDPRGGPAGLAPQEGAVYERLAQLGIRWERYEHPPVMTAEDGERHWQGIVATHCKNLFLRNQKGNRHYLVIVPHDARADLRAVASQIGDGRLSFASADRLMTHLGVTPGSVSPFGLIIDRAAHVRVFLDRRLRTADRISFHPNVNTATIVLRFEDFERFLAACGNPIRYIGVGGAAVPWEE